MRKLILMGLLGIVGFTATTAEAARPVKVIHRLGQSPLKTCGPPATRHNASAVAFKLTPTEGDELKKLIIEGKGRVAVIPNGTQFDVYLGCGRNGKPIDIADHSIPELQVPYTVTSMIYTLASGQSVEIIDSEGELCGNWVKRASWLYTLPTKPAPPKVTVTYTPPAETLVMEELQEVSVYRHHQKLKLTPEFSAGVGVYDNSIAHGDFAWGEALLWAPVAKNLEAGIGLYGMLGGGESENGSAYRYHEEGFGFQGGLRGTDYVTEIDEFGNEVTLPAGWEVKLRVLPWDSVGGRNPDSGYFNRQNGSKFGIYGGRYWRKLNGDLVGITAEGWVSNAKKFASSWHGDKPQNRGSIRLDGFVQTRLSKHWQFRGIIGGSHGFWDKQSWLNGCGELRFKEVIMFGPCLSLPIGKAALYRGVPWKELITGKAFIRIESGGLYRKIQYNRLAKAYKRHSTLAEMRASTTATTSEE